ncbi:MAG: hypothetical protein H3C53_09285 [Trueperaceae bacterium]|nr:hypothetical protein [Trueperaceae bacterium]
MNRSMACGRWSAVAAVCLLGVALAQRPVVLSGNMTNPTEKSGTVVAWAGYFDMSPTGVIAFGEVTAAGDFAFELPRAVHGDVLHPVEAKNICQSGGQGLTVQPAGTTHVFVNTLMAFDLTATPVTAVLASSPEFLARLAADKRDLLPGDALGYYLYVERGLTLQGSCVSPDGVNVEYDVRAGAGWSRLAYTFDVVDGGVVGKIATVREFPPQVGWVSSVR